MSWNYAPASLKLGATTDDLRELLSSSEIAPAEYQAAHLQAQARQIQLLEQLADDTGTLSEDGVSLVGDEGLTQSFGTATSGGTVGGPLNTDGLHILETADMGFADPGGTITLQPGEEEALIEYTTSGQIIAVRAVGASDANDVEYGLRIDRDQIIGGWTESPLGSINDPFSFVEKLGGYVEAGSTVEYRARVNPDGSETTLAARAYIEELDA